MFIRRCAGNRFVIIQRIRTRISARSGPLFFFILAGATVLTLSAAAPSSAGEIVSSPPLAPSTPSPTNKTTLPAEYSRETTQIVVSLSLNGESKGDFFVELDAAGELYVRREELSGLKLNFAEDQAVLIRNEPYVPLSAVREVKYFFDEKSLTVSLMGKTTEAQQTSIDLYPLRFRPQNVYYPRETSAFLNYGVTYAYADPLGFQAFTMSNKLGARTGDLFFVSDSLYTSTRSDDNFVRLQTSATYEQRNNLQWFVLGDQFANSGDLGSTVNMGGVGISKVYRIDPYFITQPVFNIKGVTAFPSQADIYMDGVLVSKQALAPGSFDLKNIYSYGGAHTIDVVLKDPFGREQRISYPTYFSTLLLREGLHEYSYNAGFIREQYGVRSSEYGASAFSAFHRYGVTNNLNVGARAEGSGGVTNAGLFTSLSIPRAGAFTVSLAASSEHGTIGSAASFQHTYQLLSFNTNLLVREFSRDYATVGAPPSPDSTKYELGLSAGFLLLPFGSASLGYSESGTHGGTTTRVSTISGSRGLSKSTSLFVTASATRIVDTTYSLFLGINVNFEKDVHGAAQYTRTGETNTETLQVQKDAPVGEGLGYRASLARTDTGAAYSSSFNPYVQYNARYGIYSLDSSFQNSKVSTNGQDYSTSTSKTYTLSASGSLVDAGGFYGLSRPVSDSFSVVTVDNVSDATVLNNGQEIGKTNASGMMVVPSLTSYSQNQITLDVKNIPMDYSISGVNAVLSPSLWSGSCIAFQAAKVQAVTGSLVTRQNEKKIPLEYVDITMKVDEKEVTFPTGKDGEFYAENALPEDGKTGVKDKQSCRAIVQRRTSGGNAIKPGTYEASVNRDGKRCTFDITFPKTEDPITELGEVACVAVETVHGSARPLPPYSSPGNTTN